MKRKASRGSKKANISQEIASEPEENIVSENDENDKENGADRSASEFEEPDEKKRKSRGENKFTMKRKSSRGSKKANISQEVASESEENIVSESDENDKENGTDRSASEFEEPDEKKRKSRGENKEKKTTKGKSKRSRALKKDVENGSGEENGESEADEKSEYEEKKMKTKSKKSKVLEKGIENGSGEENSENEGDEEPEYEVDKIIDTKMVRGVRHFLVRWKGFDAESDTWEPESTLNCPEALAAYKKSNRGSKQGLKRKSKGNKEKEVESASGDEDDKEEEEEETEPKDKKAVNNKTAKRKKGVEKDVENHSDEEIIEDDEASEESEYEVEKIIDDKVLRGIRHYLVRWKGYTAESDTWEPESTLNCPEALAAYKKSNKGSDSSKNNKKKTKSTYIKKTPEPQEEWDENENFEVVRILDVYFRKDGKKEFLVSWKGYSHHYDSWEPEENMNCKNLIEQYLEKCEKAKQVTPKDLRMNRKTTDRFTLSTKEQGRRVSRRNEGRQRVQYHDAE